MKFKTKIIISFSSLITIAFAFMMLFVYYSISSTNEKIIDVQSRQLFDSKANEAGSWLEQRIAELEVIALSPTVQSMDFDRIRQYVNTLNDDVGKRYGNEWGTFAIGQLDGIGWVSNDKTINVSDRDYFQLAISGNDKYILSKPVFSKTDHAPISLICYPLRKDNQTFGFINGAIALNRLNQLVESIDFYDGISWIMDADAYHYTILPDTINQQKLNSFAAMLANNPSSSTISQTIDESILYFTPIPNTPNWYLCTQVQLATLMKPTVSLLTTLFFVWLMLLIATIIIAIVLSKTISQPLAKLCQSMDTAGEGDLTVHVSTSGNDEFAKLARSFNHLTTKVQQLMHQLVENEKEKRKAELRTLQAQINPHFLYNTLDTIHWMAYDHKDKDMLQIIDALSNFYRISLSKGDEFIPLTKEIDHVTSYLQIQKLRFDEQFTYNIINENIHDNYIILKVLLQPIVENAIVHGIKPCPHPCKITIYLRQENDLLTIKVMDNGIGISNSKLLELTQNLQTGKLGHGYGLINVNQRIRLTYGNQYKLTITSKQEIGTTVTLTIPAIKEKNNVESIDM